MTQPNKDGASIICREQLLPHESCSGTLERCRRTTGAGSVFPPKQNAGTRYGDGWTESTTAAGDVAGAADRHPRARHIHAPASGGTNG